MSSVINEFHHNTGQNKKITRNIVKKSVFHPLESEKKLKENWSEISEIGRLDERQFLGIFSWHWEDDIRTSGFGSEGDVRVENWAKDTKNWKEDSYT